MKGGRLHRPEPLGPQTTVAASASASASAPTPADDWVDGSWTVDCSCGVTFDDGEEMVSCDECSVWVHTRCARYLRTVQSSFSCHNCKYKRAPSSADETEVAELLAELPTHRPPPLYRRWAEVPLPARVHVHGVPGGSDAALFRGAPASPAFSAALWRCAGYVPKKFGFRYCEFPSWAEDKDGADALFALAREKRKDTVEVRFPLPLGAVRRKESKTTQILNKKADGSQRSDGAAPQADAKKRGASFITAEVDTWENGFQQKGDLAAADFILKDQCADVNMAISDFQVVVEANKKTKESLKPIGEKKSPEGISGMLKTDESKESVGLEISSGGRTTSAVAEQEVHSRFVKVEVSMCKQQVEENQNLGSQSDIMNTVVKVDVGTRSSNGEMRIHASSEKMHEGQGLQKQLNQTSSNLQVATGGLDLQTGQSKARNIKSEVPFQDHEKNATHLVDDKHRSDKQGQGVSEGVRRNSARSIPDSGSDLPNYETKSQMHTIPNQNPVLGVQKVCTASSGSTSSHFELSRSVVSTEPSSGGKTGRLMKKEQTRLFAPAESKHDSVKHSVESSEEFSRSSEKVQPKGALPSAPKSSQTNRLYVSSAKHRVPVSKEQSQKTISTGGTSGRSFHGEVTPLNSRNKAIPSSFSQKKEKIHHRCVHTTQEGSTNSTSTELRASDATASLSDEQLALLLHQQLNSSPRVPRVPRGHQAGSMQMLHPTGATVFSKRSSAHGGRDQTTVLKKRNKDDGALRDNDDAKRSGKVSVVERRHRDYSTERIPSSKDSCRLADNIESKEQNHGVCSNEATTGLAKDDLMDSSITRNLPGLIDEIISRNRNITYGELCDAVGQHWRGSVKSNREDYAQSSYLHAVNDCLRNKSEWAHLVSQSPKMNPSKRRKVECDSLLADVLETGEMGNRDERYPGEEGSSDSQGPPRGKRKAWKHSDLEMKDLNEDDTKKRSNIGSSSEDAAATLSDSSSDTNGTPMDDESQDDYSAGGNMEPKTADSSS